MALRKSVVAVGLGVGVYVSKVSVCIKVDYTTLTVR